MAALHDAPTLVIADPSTQETQDATLVMETQEQQARSASQAEEPQANGASQAEEPQANGASSALQTNPAGEASVASGDADEQGVQDVQKAIVNFACYHKLDVYSHLRVRLKGKKDGSNNAAFSKTGNEAVAAGRATKKAKMQAEQAAEANPGPDNSETSSVKSKTKKDQTGPKKEKEVKEFLAMEQSSDVAIGRVKKEHGDGYVGKLVEFVTVLGPPISKMAEAAFQIEQMANAKLQAADALKSAGKPKAKAKGKGIKRSASTKSLPSVV
eukprot:s3705_g2.t1